MDERTGAGQYDQASMNGQNTQLKMSRHGKFAASVNSKFGVRVWDTKTGACLATLQGVFVDCDFAPDSSVLVTAGRDLMVRVYDTKTFSKVEGVELDMVDDRVMNSTMADRVLFVDDDVCSITTTSKTVLGLNVRTGERVKVGEGTLRAAASNEKEGRVRLVKTRMQHLSMPGYEIGFTTDSTYKVYSRVNLKEGVAVVSEGPSLHILRLVGDGKSSAVHPTVKADLQVEAIRKEERKVRRKQKEKDRLERYAQSQALGKKMARDREDRKQLEGQWGSKTKGK